VAERIVPRGNAEPDRLLQALIELARSAMRNDRDRRAKITVMEGGKRAA
jgi:hypothetical protein